MSWIILASITIIVVLAIEKATEQDCFDVDVDSIDRHFAGK